MWPWVLLSLTLPQSSPYEAQHPATPSENDPSFPKRGHGIIATCEDGRLQDTSMCTDKTPLGRWKLARAITTLLNIMVVNSSQFCRAGTIQVITIALLGTLISVCPIIFATSAERKEQFVFHPFLEVRYPFSKSETAIHCCANPPLDILNPSRTASKLFTDAVSQKQTMHFFNPWFLEPHSWPQMLPKDPKRPKMDGPDTEARSRRPQAYHRAPNSLPRHGAKPDRMPRASSICSHQKKGGVGGMLACKVQIAGTESGQAAWRRDIGIHSMVRTPPRLVLSVICVRHDASSSPPP